MISIIIPSYVIDEENETYLYKCIQYLEASTKREMYQLIIVDNGSKLGMDYMKKKADIYIRKDKPMGYARATNLGLAMADGDYLCILNNDLFVPDGWLETMVEVYNEERGGILAPMTNPIHEQKTFYNSHWFSLILMDRNTFTKVGYLDEDLNYRYHDQDYSIRVKKAGFEVMRTGKVIVEHVNMATWKKMDNLKDNQERERMIKKNGVALLNEWIKKNAI